MPDIIAAHAISQRALSIHFDNEYQGILKLDDFINNYTGVFKPLLNPEYLDRVSINTDLGTVCWPNGAGLCPDSVYTHMQKVCALNVPT